MKAVVSSRGVDMDQNSIYDATKYLYDHRKEPMRNSMWNRMAGILEVFLKHYRTGTLGRGLAC